MLTRIDPEKVLRTFGIAGVTYFPRTLGAHLHADTARFLSAVGVPSNFFFSPTLDLDAPARLDHAPSLKASFARDGAQCPPESEAWEVLGEFLYALVAIDPKDGKIYAFPEGEECYVPLHTDVSSLVHALIVLEDGQHQYKNLPSGDEQAYASAVDRMRRRITDIDDVPFAGPDSEWSKLFEEIAFGMWG